VWEMLIYLFKVSSCW